MRRFKAWIITFFSVTASLCVLVGGLNYLIDPLRVFSEDYDKSCEGMRASGPEYIALKASGNHYDYALVGSSRHLMVDLRFIHQQLRKDCVNLGINECSFYDALIIAKAVKKQGKNFICGLDAFSMNASRYTGKVFAAKQARISEAIENGRGNLVLFFGSSMLRFSLDTIRLKVLGRSFNERLDEKDKKVHPYDEGRIQALFRNDRNVRYSHFRTPPEDLLLELAETAGEKDIFVIYPKYCAWYKYMRENGVDSLYFEAVSKIVKNTRARVYCFYGKYPLTEDRYNFDKDGWHFKSSVSRLIFKKIFTGSSGIEDREFGFLLTAANVDDYLSKILDEMKTSFPAAELPGGTAG